MFKKLLEAKESLQKKAGISEIDVVIITGTGIEISLQGTTQKSVEYSEVQHIPIPSSKTHKGFFEFVRTEGKNVCIAHGRIHYYEKYSMQEVVFMVRVLGLLKPHVFIITNAAGGLRTTFQPGDLMAIVDHINLMGANPLKGDNIDEIGE